ncbi:MAG: CrcB family protein [Candidatus Anaerobiospirillum merdipullorum]|uniref:CrcB family protein n=1 Tax=Candidatus Anaerobiospirillum merdipullorum TaxID=2838450 RepID=A0A9E2KMN5_9GAMM|nr:CrcB family protein [Candidatus Anaerobiospirillum merdipullorum]
MKDKFILYLAVFVGAAAGTALRMLADGNVMVYLLLPNLLACFLMGASCFYLSRARVAELYRKAVNAGFLGGLSTYGAPALAQLVAGEVTFFSLLGLFSELMAYLAVSALGWGIAAAGFILWQLWHKGKA